MIYYMYIKNIDNETLIFLYLDHFIFVHPIDLVNCQSCLTVYIFLNILISLYQIVLKMIFVAKRQ